MAAGLVSVAQLTMLIDFMESHPQLALGRCTRTKEGRCLAKRLWAEVATLLNSISSDGTFKTPEMWRTYYNEYKSKLLKKVKSEKTNRSATGGGPGLEIQLTPLQDRLYEILGRDVGEPLPGVRHNPLFINERNGSEEGLVGEPGPSFAQPNVSYSDDEQYGQLERDPQFQFLEVENQQLPVSQNNNSSEILKNRKRKTISKKADKENCSDEIQNETVQEAAASLRQIEQIGADALLVHAAAINRLAAAIELLADRLPISAASPFTARGRSRRRIVTSSSDSD